MDPETGELYFHPKRNLSKGSQPLFGQAALSQARATQSRRSGDGGVAHADVSGPEFDFLESELAYSKEQRRQLPFFFAFMKDARDFYDELIAPDAPFRWHVIRDGDVLRTPDRSVALRCVETPGHASDHFAFALEETEIERSSSGRGGGSVFSGDHILGEGTSVVVDMFDYMSSLNRLLAIEPRALFCGHGPVVRDGVDLLTRYKRHRRSREVQVWDCVARATACDTAKENGRTTTVTSASTAPVITSESIAKFLYRDTPADKMLQATTNVHKILHGLFREGLVAASFRSSPKRPISVDDLGSPYERSQAKFFESVCWMPVRTPRVREIMARRARFVSTEHDREFPVVDADGVGDTSAPSESSIEPHSEERLSAMPSQSKL